jgi:hypothetical protein
MPDSTFIKPIISTSSKITTELLQYEETCPNPYSSAVLIEDPVTRELIQDIIYQEDYSRVEFIQDSRFLFGRPGSGKTELLKKLEEQYTQDNKNTRNETLEKSKIVQFIKLKECYQNNPTEDNLSKKIEKDTSLLLLDGLDEINELFIHRLLEDINNLTNNRENLTTIISSRTYLLERYPELKNLKNFKYSVISPFDEEKQKEFIRSYANPPRPYATKSSLTETQKNSLTYLWQPKIKLYSNPRYLSILCSLVMNGIIAESEIENLSRYDIFEKLTRSSLDQTLEKSQPEIYLNVLQKLATVISIKGDTEINSEDLMDFFDYAQFDSKAVVLNKDSLKTLYDKCLLRKGKSGSFDYIEFDDREIQEFLTAKELIKISKHLNLFAKLCFSENPIRFKSHWLNSLNFFIEKKPDDFLKLLKHCHRVSDSSQINNIFHYIFEYLEIKSLSEKDKEEIFTILFKYYKEQKFWLFGPHYRLSIKLAKLYNHENANHKKLVFEYVINSLKEYRSLSNTDEYNYVSTTNALLVIQESFEKLSAEDKNSLKTVLIKDINIALPNEDSRQILLQERLELLSQYKDKSLLEEECIKELFTDPKLTAAPDQAKIIIQPLPLQDISLNRLLQLGCESDEENELFLNLLIKNHRPKHSHECNVNIVIFQKNYLTKKINSKKNIKKILDAILSETSENQKLFINDNYCLDLEEPKSFSGRIYELLGQKESETYLRKFFYSDKFRCYWRCDLKNALLEKVLEENKEWLDEEIQRIKEDKDAQDKLNSLLNISNTERKNLVLDQLNQQNILIILEILKDDKVYLSRLIEFLIKSNNPNKENIYKEISSKTGLNTQEDENIDETLITKNRAEPEKPKDRDFQITANQNRYNQILKLSLEELISNYLQEYQPDKNFYTKALQERYPSLREELETEIKKQSKKIFDDLSQKSEDPSDLYFRINPLINIYDSHSLSEFLKDLILEYPQGLNFYTSIIRDLDLRLKNENFLAKLLERLIDIPEANGTKATITTLRISRYSDLKLAKARLNDILGQKGNHWVLAMHSMEEHREALARFNNKELFFGEDEIFKKILNLCKKNLTEDYSKYGMLSNLFSMLCENLKTLSIKAESREILNKLEQEFKQLEPFPHHNLLKITLHDLRAYFTNLDKPASMVEASLLYNNLRDSIPVDIPDSYALKEKVLKILEKDEQGFWKTILEKIKKKTKKKTKSQESTESDIQDDQNLSKPATEPEIQNEIKLFIENRFYKEGLSLIEVIREPETNDGKEADFLISYGLVNPVLVELKLSRHDDVLSDESNKNIEDTESYKQFLHYKNDFYCDYGILLLLDTESHKLKTWQSKETKMKKAYGAIPNVEVISFSSNSKD